MTPEQCPWCKSDDVEEVNRVVRDGGRTIVYQTADGVEIPEENTGDFYCNTCGGCFNADDCPESEND